MQKPEYKMSEYKIFVASSLRLEAHREAVSEAVMAFKDSHPCPEFSDVRYEMQPDIVQTVDVVDAQRLVDEQLVQSPIFFLIMQSNIKDLTKYEFEQALGRFRHHKMPRYIFIFRQTGLEDTGDGYTYDQLLEKFNLRNCVADSAGELVMHSKVYDIPFKDIDELKRRIRQQLEKLYNLLPPEGAVLGSQLSKDHFYSDERRKEGFSDCYYRRDTIDEGLRKALEKNNGVVLLSGASLSGKTRCMKEALSDVDDGWVYAIGDRHRKLPDRLNKLAEYLEEHPNHQKLYIEIDNLDMAVEDGNCCKALNALIDRLQADDANAVLVATATNTRGLDNRLPLDNCTRLNIPPLSPAELAQAVMWFRSCGVEFSDDSIPMANGCIGALFVRMIDIRRDYNTKFLSMDIPLRRALLKAIKAQSIWRSDHFGDMGLLESMTQFFAKGNYTEEKYVDAVKSLCDNNLGVAQIDKDRLEVQEYVYQYIIDYRFLYDRNHDLMDTQIPVDEEEKRSTQLAEEHKYELRLAKDVLEYCIKQKRLRQYPDVADETLTKQVSRLMRRCDTPEVVVPALYRLWMGENDNESDDLSGILSEDRCNYVNIVNDGSEHPYIYSSIIKKYLHTVISGTGIDHAIEVYNQVPDKMRTDDLFSSLMRCACSDAEREEVYRHKDYEKFQHAPIFIQSEIEHSDDYAHCCELFKSACPTLEEDVCSIAGKLLNTTDKPYDLYNRARLLRTLATKVRTSAEFEDFCTLTRSNYISLVTDRQFLDEVYRQNVSLDPEKLSLIDLLSLLGRNTASALVCNVFGQSIEASQAIEQNLLSCIKSTLENRLTKETQIRILVSEVSCKLILQNAPRNTYDEVYQSLFSPLAIPHPRHQDRLMILRNTFTYTAMMRCRGADIYRIINLVSNHLVPHCNDPYNDLVVNRYTLNMMLGASKSVDRMYQQQINNLFDLLRVDRDTFTYNKLIEYAPDRRTIDQYWEELIKSSNKPDLFTYLSIQSNSAIDFNTALKIFLYDPQTMNDMKMPKVDVPCWMPDDKMTSALRRSQFAWQNLFGKNVTSVGESRLFTSCVKYVAEHHPDFLNDKKIYNIIVANDSFLPSLQDAVDFIKGQQFAPDSYTLGALMNRVFKIKGADQRKANGFINSFIESFPESLNSLVVNTRIKLFRAYSDSVEFVFVRCNEPDGEKTYRKTLSPMGYLLEMIKLGYPVDCYAVKNYLDIRNKCSADEQQPDYVSLVRLLREQDYHYTPNDIKYIREHFANHHMQPEVFYELPEVFTHLTPMEKNKNQAWTFQYFIKECKGLRQAEQRLENSLNNLEWVHDAYSALCAFNDILDKFIAYAKKNRYDVWKIVWKYYSKYVKDNRSVQVVPNSFTLSILAKALPFGDVESRGQLIKELGDNKDRIVIQPHILGELAKTARDVEDLKNITDAVMQMGCSPNSDTADVYLFVMHSLLRRRDSEKAVAILGDVLKYIMGDANDDVLENDRRSSLLLHLYKGCKTVNANMLHTLVLVNETDQLYTVDEIVNRISSLYPDCVTPLMSRFCYNLYDENKNRLARKYVPPLFNIHPWADHTTLLFLSSPEVMMPSGSIEEYNRFMQKLYTSQITRLERFVPNLIRCLAFVPDNPQVSRTIVEVLKFLSLGCLRCGHLLVEKASEEYGVWCRTSLDCISIRQNTALSYIVFLQHLLRVDNIDFQSDRLMLPALRKSENAFVKSVVEESVAANMAFDILSRLPQMWFDMWNTIGQKKWYPDLSTVLYIVGFYSRHFDHTHTKMVAIARALSIALSRNLDECNLYYHNLGDFPAGNNFYVRVPTHRLAVCLESYVDQLQDSSMKISKARQLPQLWHDMYMATYDAQKKMYGWKPSTSTVIALVSRYAQSPSKSFVYIASLQQSINKALTFRKPQCHVRYNSLGEFPADNGFYVDVDTQSLVRAMPHEFIVALCCRAADKDNAPSIGRIQQLAMRYLKQVDEGAVEPLPHYEWKRLWTHAKWIPSDEIREALCKV